MKYVILLSVLLFVLGCKTETKSKSITITNQEVREWVHYLASDELKGRYAGSNGIEKAATFIEDQFKANGVNPYFETYRDEFKIDSLHAFNVVGFVEGTDDLLKKEVIILGAHYDHIGFGNDARKKSRNSGITEIDSIANGANDNASGTAAVMAMAKYFGRRKTNKRSIMFVLFSAEEFGLLGSKHLSKRLKSEDLDLYTMVNFEMIGVPLKDFDYQVFVSGFDLSNMADKMNEYTSSNLVGASNFAVTNNLFKRSDNYPFYEEFKLPCQSISSCDLTNFDYYHHVDDEISALDFDFMTGLINQIIPAIEKMSTTTTKEIIMYESE